jgi:hypothetical protein
MTPLLEACLLPALFLTVVLAGAVRPGGDVTFTPPSLASLVTAVVLMVLYVRSGTLAPERLMNTQRSLLANVNGFTVLATAFLASAQAITLVVPESGAPVVIVWAVLVSLVLQVFTIAPDRPRLLRGLLVTFGAVFTLKFVLLAAISAPAEGRLSRALQLLFEGITLGSMSQRPHHALEGYVAFGTLALYLVGVALLPSATWWMIRTSGVSVDQLSGTEPPQLSTRDVRDEASNVS